MRAAVVLAAILMLCTAAALAGAKPGKPRCYGAASRDRVDPCHNPALRLVTRPSQQAATLAPAHPCRHDKTIGDPDAANRASGSLTPCHFGVPASKAVATAALIGDSHAMAWRGAVAGTLRSLGWHGISMVRTACAFTTAATRQPPADATGCRTFNERVQQWLTEHPEVTVVFFAHQSDGDYPTIRSGGRTPFGTEVAGYVDAWQRLPASVKQVIAIRDNPRMRYDTPGCIRYARRQGLPPGPSCALPRSRALRRDAYPAAVRRLDSPRYRLADLTRFMCDRARCFPVVGGAPVFKDVDHISSAFSATLWPYLTRRVRAILG